MDFIKLKLASSRLRPQPRFTPPDPMGNMTKPDLVGLVANSELHDIGCPNLSRSENLSLILGNKSKGTSILVDLKWIPSSELECVTQSVNIKFALPDNIYVYHNIETYKPETSIKKPDRITQYGSKGSNFKLILESVYRRIRIVFRGHMKVLGKPDESKFIKFSLISCPISKLFDFKTQCNPDCFQEQWRSKRPNMLLEHAIESLLFSDHIEQMYRFVGEYSIIDNDVSSKSVIFLWGFYSKSFMPELPVQNIKTKRIVCLLTNGQVFHLCHRSAEGTSFENGYTIYTIRPSSEPIEHPSDFNWDSLGPDTKEFQITVHGQSLALKFEAKRENADSLFDIVMNGTEGWAHVVLDDGIEDKQLSEAMSKSLGDYKKLLNDRASAKAQVDDPKCENTSDLLVIDIRDEICLSSELIGSKASSLAHLKRLSDHDGEFSVAEALVVSRSAYDLILEQNHELRQATQALETSMVDVSNQNELKEKCERLVQMFKDCVIPDELKSQLGTKLAQRFPGDLNEQSFAVRSSSWGEDGQEMSAAGQLSTELNIKGLEAVVQSIKNCFGSNYSYQNVEYKRQHGLGPNLPMAVIIQLMVQCDKAGVMFTCDPVTGDDVSMLVTANYGLGESVVGAQTDPDSIRLLVQPTGLKIVEKNIGKKLVVIGEQNQHDKSVCCLNDDEILKLARCGRSVAITSGAPRDIEWGFKGSELFLFQSRPVTGLELYSETELLHESDKSSRAEDEWTTRANINEVVPYPMSPFTVTYDVFGMGIFVGRMARRYADYYVDYVPECSFDVVQDSYHMFFSLRRSFWLPGSENSKQSLMAKSTQIAIFGHEVDEQPGIVNACKNIPVPPNHFSGFKFEMRTASFRLAPLKVVCKQYETTKILKSKLKNDQLVPKDEPNSMLGYYAQLNEVLRDISVCFENHYITLMIGSQYNLALQDLLANYIKEPGKLYAALNKFLSAASNVISAEIPRRIQKMANTIRAKGDKEAEIFAAMSETEALDYLQDNQNDVSKQFGEFMERFGHRCYHEFELHTIPWRQDGGKIAEMVQKSCSSGQTIVDKEKISDIDKIIDSLGVKLSLKDRLNIKHFLVPKCQIMVTAREFTKDILIIYADIKREAARKLANDMYRNLRLPDADLFFFLLADEIEPLIREPQPTIVSQAIRRRQMFDKVFKEPWIFEEIIGGYDLVPLQMRPAKQIDQATLNAPKLFGSPGSSGRVEANICIINSYSELNKVQPGDILVTYSTDIAFSPIFPIISGIVTEFGGLISHGAVVAREYGLPCLIGVQDATKILENGERIILDADNGYIVRLVKSDA